jgi:hypothetical protein
MLGDDQHKIDGLGAQSILAKKKWEVVRVDFGG